MINNKSMQQKCSENSTNIQAEGIENLTINQGLTPEEAVSMSMKLFEQNFPKLVLEAKEIVMERVEELTNEAIQKIAVEKPESFNNFKDPDMQYILNESQKSYARSGKEDLKLLLSDLLFKRVAETEDFEKIILNESIEIIPKLTKEHLNILAIIFLFKYSKRTNIRNLNDLKLMFDEFKPFMTNIIEKESHYQYIQYLGCGSVGVLEGKLDEIILKTYIGLFSKGFSVNQISDECKQVFSDNKLIIYCLNDNTKLQVNCVYEEQIDEFQSKYKLSDVHKNELKRLFKLNIMSTNEMRSILMKNDFKTDIFDTWNNSVLKMTTLTSVGIMIAITYIEQNIKQKYRTDIWI